MPSEFGPLVNQYDKIRPSYPKKVIDLIFKHTTNKQPFILDIGCGTGIATRQLAKHSGFIIGCDIDNNMLNAALSHTQPNTAYIQSSADKLPFKNQTFDTVTAFTSFHWFANNKSLGEIKRVLKPNGCLCIIQPFHTAPFKKDFKQLIEKELGHTITPKYGTNNITETIKNAKFKIIETETIKVNDKYQLEDYITLLQSYSIWNFIPQSHHKKFIPKLKKHYQNLLTKDRIHETRDIKIYIAKK